MSVNGADEAFKAQVRICLRQLAGWNLGGRPAVLQRLREMGPQVVDVLHEILEGEAHPPKRDLSGRHLVPIVVVVVTISEIATHLNRSSVPLPVTFLFDMFFLVMCGLVLRQSLKMTPNQQELLSVLAELNDPRSTRFFIAALRTGDLRTKLKAGDALTHVLPYLSGADVALVPIQDRTVLYNLLLSDDRALKLSILSAIPAFDDFLALPMVERLATDARLKNSDPEVYNLARSVLAVLTGRRDAAVMAGTLLRASAANNFSETALRPANSGRPANPDLLLRATLTDNSKQ